MFPPRVAILATGNELVDAGEPSGRRTDSQQQRTAACGGRGTAGGMPIDLGIARDEPADLRTKIEQGLAADVLMISGGVSAGVLDLVPAVLRDLGVEQVFHKVNLKPGKPLWFGTRKLRTLVFGLPGNPVSSLVCFELFVRPAIAKLSGRDPSTGLRQLPAGWCGVRAPRRP